MNPALVILLIFGFNVAVWIPIIMWTRRKAARLIRETEDSLVLAGEHAIVGPKLVLFHKSMFRWFGLISGNAVAVLTDKRLIVRPLAGSTMEIPVDEIAEVRQSKWYRGSYRGGYTNVILKLQDGRQIALLVIDPERWMEGLHGKG